MCRGKDQGAQPSRMLRTNVHAEVEDSIRVSIENFSQLPYEKPCGSWSTPTFRLCEHDWQLRVFPNGREIVPQVEVLEYRRSYNPPRFRSGTQETQIDWVHIARTELEPAVAAPEKQKKQKKQKKEKKEKKEAAPEAAPAAAATDRATDKPFLARLMITTHCSHKSTLTHSSKAVGNRPMTITPGFVWQNVLESCPPVAPSDTDCIHIDICMIVLGLPRESVGVGCAAQQLSPEATALRDFATLLNSGVGADVTFKVGAAGTAVAAHRAVLVARSTVFGTMLGAEWAESTASAASSSAAESAIAVPDVEPAAFAELLRFLYAGTCSEGALAAMPAHLFEAAAKYAVGDLQALASRELVESLNAQTACDYFALAHAHDDDVLLRACARLVSFDMHAVTTTDGFKRLSTERPALMAALMTTIGELSSPRKSRKRKRGASSGGAGASADAEDGSSTSSMSSDSD
jgi:hypothetical protein